MSEAEASDQTQSFDTRVAHQVLMDGLDNIQDSLKNADIDRKIEVGSVLWELWDRTKKVLDSIKSDVRKEAVRELDGVVGTVTLDGDDRGSAMVTVLSASLRIPKGKNVGDVKGTLGSKFSLFFDEVTTYKPHKEFESRVENLDDALVQKILLDSVERHEMTPRVTFRRDRPSRRTKGDSDPEAKKNARDRSTKATADEDALDSVLDNS